MNELFPPTLDDAIAEVERELRVRERAYPRFVANGTVTQARADKQMAAMREAREHLHRLKGLEK